MTERRLEVNDVQVSLAITAGEGQAVSGVDVDFNKGET
ncbi:ABC transporter ATP-binding protein, partial [Staphylococcus aureus]|nr:ABC transporter ATP-binding protein [Staphylococcus aureus]